MSASETARLRREGRYDEAYNMAINDITSRNDEWSRSALFWTLRDVCLYGCLPQHKTELAENCVTLMGKLLRRMPDANGLAKQAYRNLHKHFTPECEVMTRAVLLSKTNPKEAFENISLLVGGRWNLLRPDWHEDLGWMIYRYIKHEQNCLPPAEVRRLLGLYIRLDNRRPSTLHSAMLELAMHCWKKQAGFSFYNFVRTWNTRNFRNADMASTQYNGHVKEALIIRVFRTLAVGGEDINIHELILPLSIEKETALDLFRHPIHDRLVALHAAGRFSQLWRAFTVYAQCHAFFGPSVWHSRILSLALQFMQGDDAKRFPPFLQRWGTDNFMTADWFSSAADSTVSSRSLAVMSARRCAGHFALRQPSNELAGLAQWAQKVCAVMQRHEQCGIVTSPDNGSPECSANPLSRQ